MITNKQLSDKLDLVLGELRKLNQSVGVIVNTKETLLVVATLIGGMVGLIFLIQLVLSAAH